MLTSDFLYELPPDRIAQIPVEPRDAARLFDARTMKDHRFAHLPDLLQPGDLVVVNRTRVRHARLHGYKVDTGGRVEVLLLGALADGTWEAMIRPARKIRPGLKLTLAGLAAETIGEPVDGLLRLRFDDDLDVEAAVEKVGEIPLPPYITAPLDDPGRYQTIYADRPGSAAAPTAGFHFTESVLSGLERRGIGVATVDLEVGIGTFRPITTESVEEHAMHPEPFEVGPAAAEAIARCRRAGGRVVAVGTTTLRALETATGEDGVVRPQRGVTRLYLTPGTPIRSADLLVTNFHLPGSSLLVLLEAFMGRRWREVYRQALDRGFRFLSFGDVMICERLP